MGQALAASIRQSSRLALTGVWKRGGDIDGLAAAADVLIDFSLPEGTENVLDAVVRHGTPLVCGVSGLTDAQLQKLNLAAAQIPLVFDRNMSLGVAILERSVREAAAALGPDFSVEIAETHHLNKRDAPSGTALKLAEAIADSRGERSTGTATFTVERRGEVPGDHDVLMRNESESLRFAHSVSTRDVFVTGALRAAAWVVKQEPGRYGMQDVLFRGTE